MTLKILKSMFKFVISFLLISIMTFSANATCVFNCPKTVETNEIIDLRTAGESTLQKPNVVKDITGYNFPEKLLFSDVEKYRTIMHTIWKMPMRARNSSGVLEDPACIEALAKYSFSDTKGCVGGLEWAIHSALFDDERMDLNRFRNFFEDIIPQILNNQSYLDGPRNDIHYFRAMQSFYMAYALYGDIYGVSDELDAAMANHFEAFIDNAMGDMDKKKVASCKQFPDTKENYLNMRIDNLQGCSNSGAIEWVKLFTAMGIVTKRADFINEALLRLDSFISSTFEEGVPQDALRAGDAPGYLAQMMENLDDVGFMFENYLGMDIWDRRAGGYWNNSVGDILTYSIRAFLDPKINIEYAKVNDILKGKDHYECCAGDENWKSAPGRNNDPIEIQKTINSYLLGTSWALLKLGNKDLLNRIEPDRPNVVWRTMNTFPNKIVMLQSSNSKNQLTILTREIDQKEMESLIEKLGETDSNNKFDFSQYDLLQENLRCNFQIERELLDNGNKGKIAEGELEVLRGNVIFLRENWNTGSGDNQLLSKQSNLKIASDGRLIGTTPLYTMFGNNQIHTAVFEKNFKSRNQNLNAEGININIIENHIKIILELNNCK